MIEPLKPKPDSKSHVVILDFDFDYEVDDVEEMVRLWKLEGVEFASVAPLKCPGLVQIFTLHHPFLLEFLLNSLQIPVLLSYYFYLQ